MMTNNKEERRDPVITYIYIFAGIIVIISLIVVVVLAISFYNSDLGPSDEKTFCIDYDGDYIERSWPLLDLCIVKDKISGVEHECTVKTYGDDIWLKCD